jgi:aspartyl/asparaginyl-tRNA synthetase
MKPDSQNKPPSQERSIAVKAKIKDILEGQYFVEEGWTPNYLLTKNNKKISRVNILAIVLNKENNGSLTSFQLDDGTGKITARSFEEIPAINDLNIGTSVLIIGRIREYNQEKYLSPEIIKEVDKLWLKHRSLELNLTPITITPEETPPLIIEPKKEEEDLLPSQKILNLIKELDQGQGISIEEVISNSSLENTEQILNRMIETGEIFQNLPGKVKVL